MLIMKTSLVSIIIPTFNSEKFILETIQSVQNQTYELAGR
jgi:glycosyltransferase involved in cell wall biosynthesis